MTWSIHDGDLGCNFHRSILESATVQSHVPFPWKVLRCIEPLCFLRSGFFFLAKSLFLLHLGKYRAF